jgi:hypothetical protein
VEIRDESCRLKAILGVLSAESCLLKNKATLKMTCVRGRVPVCDRVHVHFLVHVHVQVHIHARV